MNFMCLQPWGLCLGPPRGLRLASLRKTVSPHDSVLSNLATRIKVTTSNIFLLVIYFYLFHHQFSIPLIVLTINYTFLLVYAEKLG